MTWHKIIDHFISCSSQDQLGCLFELVFSMLGQCSLKCHQIRIVTKLEVSPYLTDVVFYWLFCFVLAKGRRTSNLCFASFLSLIS